MLVNGIVLICVTVAGSASDTEKLASRVPISSNTRGSRDKEESVYIKMTGCSNGVVRYFPFTWLYYFYCKASYICAILQQYFVAVHFFILSRLLSKHWQIIVILLIILQSLFRRGHFSRSWSVQIRYKNERFVIDTRAYVVYRLSLSWWKMTKKFANFSYDNVYTIRPVWPKASHFFSLF